MPFESNGVAPGSISRDSGKVQLGIWIRTIYISDGGRVIEGIITVG